MWSSKDCASHARPCRQRPAGTIGNVGLNDCCVRGKSPRRIEHRRIGIFHRIDAKPGFDLLHRGAIAMRTPDEFEARRGSCVLQAQPHGQEAAVGRARFDIAVKRMLRVPTPDDEMRGPQNDVFAEDRTHQPEDARVAGDLVIMMVGDGGRLAPHLFLLLFLDQPGEKPGTFLAAEDPERASETVALDVVDHQSALFR